MVENDTGIRGIIIIGVFTYSLRMLTGFSSKRCGI